MSDSLPSAGYFSDDLHPTVSTPGGDQVALRRGLVGQVRIVAILSMIEGVLELLMATFFLFVGTIFGFGRAEFAKALEKGGDPNGSLFVNFAMIFYCAFGSIILIIAALRIYASMRNYYFQSRVLGVVTACLGLASAFSGICALPAIGLGVYALIVYFNKEVTEAFEMRDKGASADDVINTFNSRPS